jgi:predicted unusual protein kinase regulating ubiquinone biosynthesis (AarF/ABC1/UbiB family)
MTFMEGVKITDFDALERMQISRTAVATRLVQCFYKQLFVHRFFHADPHPGNFLVQRGADGRPLLVVLDFGAISEAKDELIEGLLDVVQGLFSSNSDKLIDGFWRMGFAAPGADRGMLEQITRTYFGKLMKIQDRSPQGLFAKTQEMRRDSINPEMEIDDLRDLMRSVHYPDTWFFVERATVLLFWLSATIDPSLNTVQVGFPYVFPLLLERNRRASAHASEAPPRAANA